MAVRKQLSEDTFTHLHNIFRLNKRPILQATNSKKENVLPCLVHFYPIDIRSSYLEETANILEDIDEQPSKEIK